MGSMKGMLTEDDLASLKKATGKVFDWVGSFDNTEGVMRRELYEDHKVHH